jgi:hypothetical protein
MPPALQDGRAMPAGRALSWSNAQSRVSEPRIFLAVDRPCLLQVWWP